ncbi:CBS domain-containing protein [Chitinophagaceae bacterium 26-R-25]|nr:CBS domain-containing protein [Chitinophagaceae bacterium 26-R-25]
MKKVSDILSQKKYTLIAVTPDTTVLEALNVMAEKNIGSVLVMEGEEYFGLLTERDYSRKVILKSKSSTDTKVYDIMSIGLPRITPDNSIEVCMHLMSENNIRYLPVFENDKVCGIISVNDVIKAIISHQEETIAHLESYIHS